MEYSGYHDYKSEKRENVETVFLYADAVTLERFARILGKYEDKEKLSAAQALPLYWGMVPVDKESDVALALRYRMKKDEAPVSGEKGLPYVTS